MSKESGPKTRPGKETDMPKTHLEHGITLLSGALFDYQNPPSV